MTSLGSRIFFNLLKGTYYILPTRIIMISDNNKRDRYLNIHWEFNINESINLPSSQLEPRTPIFFVIYLMISILSVIALDRKGEISELDGVALSTVIATSLWYLSQKNFNFASYGRNFVYLVNVIFALKIVLGLLHFYLLFAPVVGIPSAADSQRANFGGDLAPICSAAQVFMSERESSGLFGAIFSDYYRAINNSGVGVIYGLLFGCFGKYATVAVPWNALAMGFAGMILGKCDWNPS